MPPPLVSVIILNWNGKAYLEACLDSVLAQKGGDFEVILVDNGSTDGSAAWVRARFPAVEVIEAGRNLGFAAGNNLGVRRSRGKIAVLLNNDTVVQPGWLAALLRGMDDPAAVLLSSRVVTEGVPDRYYERNGSLNFVGHNIMRVFAQRENLFFCSGASIAFRKDVFGEPFDPDYFLYSEDVYLGLRARFMGHIPRHVDDSIVHHVGGATSASQPSPLLTMFQERNRLLNMLLFFSVWSNLRFLPFWIGNIVAKCVLALGGHKYSLRGLLLAYWWVVSHPRFILGRRKALQSERRVPEHEVIAWMTAHMTNGESRLGRGVNAVARGYCRLVGLRTVERFPAGYR